MSSPFPFAEPGVGAISAAQILNVWSHPGRLRSEAAFAAQSQLPHVSQQAHALAVPPVDAVFLAGLDWILDGIERQSSHDVT